MMSMDAERFATFVDFLETLSGKPRDDIHRLMNAHFPDCTGHDLNAAMLEVGRRHEVRQLKLTTEIEIARRLSGLLRGGSPLLTIGEAVRRGRDAGDPFCEWAMRSGFMAVRWNRDGTAEISEQLLESYRAFAAGEAA